ncbi:MAG: hypothetical protein IT561_14955 [Alphaproteobacteria bacterium]|nr:hypothetical protein [Alphaproteobacteria bacterium]
MAGDWSDEQNDAIVADYFSMLADDIAGRPYRVRNPRYRIVWNDSANGGRLGDDVAHCPRRLALVEGDALMYLMMCVAVASHPREGFVSWQKSLHN